MNKERNPLEIPGLLEIISTVIRIIKKNLLLFVIMNLLALGVALYIRYGMPPEYKSNTTLALRYINNGRAINLIDDLNTLAAYQDYEALAKLLDISQQTAEKIKGLDARSVDDIDLKNGIEMFSESLEQYVVSISVTVYDYNTLEDLQKGLIHYFENNEYRKQERAMEMAFLNDMIKRSDYELKTSDSLRQLISKKMANGNQSLLMMENVEGSIIETAEKRANYINQMNRINQIQVVQPFVKFKKNTRNRLLVVLLISFVIANVIAFTVGLGREYIRLND